MIWLISAPSRLEEEEERKGESGEVRRSPAYFHRHKGQGQSSKQDVYRSWSPFRPMLPGSGTATPQWWKNLFPLQHSGAAGTFSLPVGNTSIILPTRYRARSEEVWCSGERPFSL